VCPVLKVDHKPAIDLLKAVRSIKGVKKVFVSSGIRTDLVIHDDTHGDEYLKDVTTNHVSGQMKIAPEHSEAQVLHHMGKPGISDLLAFKQRFDNHSRNAGRKQFLTYYFIAAHPGCTMADMQNLSAFVHKKLKINPEQVQIFTPTPSTYASLMYYTERDPFTGEKIPVSKSFHERQDQKDVVQRKHKKQAVRKRTGKKVSKHQRKRKT
jgi:uncharacterized radical SAM protein YgiQ